MTDAQIRAALDAFGLVGATYSLPQSGYRNSSYAVTFQDRMYNLLIHKDEPGIVDRIGRTNTLGRLLHESGLPVRFPLDPRILELRMGVKKYAVLYNYLPGKTIAWEGFTMKHVKLLGWAMASLHTSMRHIDHTALAFPSVYDEYAQILGRMQLYFSDMAVARAIRSKLKLNLKPSVITELLDFAHACQALPGSQLLHMDMVRGNVLFGTSDGSQLFAVDTIALTGIIDFEKAAVGHPLFDIARTLAFLTVDVTAKSEKQLQDYFLASGYIKRGKNQVKATSVKTSNGVKKDVLETATTLFLLYDFYKFLRSNPYESLPENHHYLRTVAALQRRGTLSTL